LLLGTPAAIFVKGLDEQRNIIFFNMSYEKQVLKTTYERRSLHNWRGRDSGCPVAKTYLYFISKV
jgi:hypothetical protein